LYRKAIYHRLSPSERVSFWQIHLQKYLTATAGLSAEQRQFIEGVISRLPVYMNPDSGRAAIKSDSAQERGARLFERRQAIEIFGTLGPMPESTPIEVTQPAGGPSADEKVDNAEGASIRDYVCNCVQNSNFSCVGNSCMPVGGVCIKTPDGCGFLGLSGCDGVCWGTE
jgi:hypothetical protein